MICLCAAVRCVGKVSLSVRVLRRFRLFLAIAMMSQITRRPGGFVGDTKLKLTEREGDHWPHVDSLGLDGSVI